MSEHSTPEERTEMPTDRRMGQLRQQGTLAMSHEVPQVMSLMAGFLALHVAWGWIWRDMLLCIRKAFGLIARHEPLTQKELFDGWLGLLYMFGPKLLFVGALFQLLHHCRCCYKPSLTSKRSSLIRGLTC